MEFSFWVHGPLIVITAYQALLFFYFFSLLFPIPLSHPPFPPQAIAFLHLMSIFFAYIYIFKMFTILLHVFLMHVSGIVLYNLISFLSSLSTVFLRFTVLLCLNLICCF